MYCIVEISGVIHVFHSLQLHFCIGPDTALMEGGRLSASVLLLSQPPFSIMADSETEKGAGLAITKADG